MALGFLASAAPIITAVAAGAGAYSAIKGANAGSQRQETQAPIIQAPPKTPDYNQIQTDERQNILRANKSKTRTILTSPLGETQGAAFGKKQLVGKLGL